jgi:hypothetical protein
VVENLSNQSRLSWTAYGEHAKARKRDPVQVAGKYHISSVAMEINQYI